MVSLTGDPLSGSTGFKMTKKGSLNPNSGMVPACKLCRYGVLPGERRVWLRKPMGISHESCASNRTDIVRVESN